MKYASKLFIAFFFLAMALPKPAHAGFVNKAGMIGCWNACLATYYMPQIPLAPGTQFDMTGVNACWGVCKTIDVMGGNFGQQGCIDACTALSCGKGATPYTWSQYYTMVTCRAFCIGAFAN